MSLNQSRIVSQKTHNVSGGNATMIVGVDKGVTGKPLKKKKVSIGSAH
jgi:hypothetical protein